MELTEVEIQQLYKWIDSARYSRPKKNITRDFSDGDKVFKRIGYRTTDEIVSAIVHMRPGYVEYLLYELRMAMEAYGSQNPMERQIYKEFKEHKEHKEHKESRDPPLIHVVQDTKAPQGGMVQSDQRKVEVTHRALPSLPKEDPSLIEMKETIKILQKKVMKLEELLRLKDERISELERKIGK